MDWDGSATESDAGDAATPERGRHVRALIVFAVAVATFAPALSNGLLGDDVLLLEVRLEESRAPTLARLFRESYWGDLHNSGLYRPLSLAILSLQRPPSGLILLLTGSST